MEFAPKLVQGTLLKRYKRFLADVKLKESGEIITVHVPNSGSMKGVSDPESQCLLSVSPNLKRKLSHTLEVVKTGGGAWVGVNTANTNKLVAEAFAEKLIPHWSEFKTIKGEVKINKESRLDFLLSMGERPKGRQRFVEVKNVSMIEPSFNGGSSVAIFPDSVTERGQKHLRDLMNLSKQGFETEIFFVVQREDCESFKPCDEIDPEYGKLLRLALASGVIVSCWSCSMKPGAIQISRPLKVDL